MIGTVNWYWQSQPSNWMSVGIGIYDENYWSKGLGFEAMGLWLEMLFTNFPKINRLDLRTWSGNTGMIKISEKLGLTLEAKFRNARLVNDIPYHSLAYGILRKEWEERYPNGFIKQFQ